MDSTTKGRRSQGSVVYEQMDRGKGHADTPPHWIIKHKQQIWPKQLRMLMTTARIRNRIFKFILKTQKSSESSDPIVLLLDTTKVLSKVHKNTDDVFTCYFLNE